MIPKLSIREGEKIAILGRNGAGKTTLLQLLAGMQVPLQGNIDLDGLDLNLIDPSDVRRDVALLNQNAHLFYGTIRENLTLGAPLASDEDVLKALAITGALHFIKEKKKAWTILFWKGNRVFGWAASGIVISPVTDSPA